MKTQLLPPEHPAKIQVLRDDYDITCIYSVGHHRMQKFKEAVKEYEGGYPTPGKFGSAKHTWWRAGRAEGHAARDKVYGYYDAAPGSPGAFPVTCMWLQ